MLIFLAICCFIEAFSQTLYFSPNMEFIDGLGVVITLFIWIMMGITFIKLDNTVKSSKEQETKINNLEIQLDYLKKHLNITDNDIQNFIKNSNSYEIDYTESEIDVLSDQAMNGMSKEEIDKLPYFNPSHKDSNSNDNSNS